MNSSEINSTPDKTSLFTLCWVTLAVGIGSGFSGTLLALLLHSIQHLAYGYSPHEIISNESFLEGVRASSAERRIIVLLLCGFIAGWGWWLLYRFGKPLVSIAEALKTNKSMPRLSTAIHALLQIVTIALGSPLGREVAPREVGALFASWISSRAGLSIKECKIMLACGAGSGLAAVYNVPFGGALFVLEVLLGTFSLPVLLPALVTSAIATLISWWGLGNETIYHIPDLALNPSIIIWSIVTGPVFGIAAYWFMRIALQQRQKAQHNLSMVFACLLNFAFIGILAIYFPVLLGNGKSPAQLEFFNPTTIGLSGLLLGLRCIIIWFSLRSGAQGGLLTPSLANGALLAVVLGGLWRFFWPETPLEAFAIIGATAFLAAAQKMPITAIILLIEFTRINFVFLVPIMCAVTGSVGTFTLCHNSHGNLRP